MPKDVVYIYTNDIHRISMSYSELIADQSFSVDSLSISLAAGSMGTMNVKAKLFACIGRSGSQLILKGETDVLDCTTKVTVVSIRTN